MNDLHEILLRGHHGVDVLVGHGDLIDHIGILAAFNAFRGLDLIRDGEHLLRLGTAHHTSRAVAAALEALGVSEAANDVASCAHASGDDSQLSALGAHGTLAGDEHVFSEVAFLLYIVVVTVHRFHMRFERLGDHLAHRGNQVGHHHFAVLHRELLGPGHTAHVITEVLSAFLEIRQILIGQISHIAFGIFLRQFDEVVTDHVTYAA